MARTTYAPRGALKATPINSQSEPILGGVVSLFVDSEEYRSLSRFGDARVPVMCQDGVTRLAHIRWKP